MGQVVSLALHASRSKELRSNPRDQLPLILSRLLAAGATDFTRVALDAWGKRELDADELLELCSAYAAITGLEIV